MPKLVEIFQKNFFVSLFLMIQTSVLLHAADTKTMCHQCESFAAVQEALKNANIEGLNLIFAVDFTKSNLTQGARTYAGELINQAEIPEQFRQIKQFGMLSPDYRKRHPREIHNQRELWYYLDKIRKLRNEDDDGEHNDHQEHDHEEEDAEKDEEEKNEENEEEKGKPEKPKKERSKKKAKKELKKAKKVEKRKRSRLLNK